MSEEFTHTHKPSKYPWYEEHTLSDPDFADLLENAAKFAREHQSYLHEVVRLETGEVNTFTFLVFTGPEPILPWA